MDTDTHDSFDCLLTNHAGCNGYTTRREDAIYPSPCKCACHD